MELNDFSPMEQLAIAQGLYKRIAGAVSTKDPDSLRSRMDREFVRDYLEKGDKSREVRVNGEKVGTYSIRVKKGGTSSALSEKDHEAFMKWIGDNPEVCTLFAMSQREKLAQFALDTTGELPDGYELVEVVTPETVAGTTFKVDEEKVEGALGNMLPNAVAGLFGGE